MPVPKGKERQRQKRKEGRQKKGFKNLIGLEMGIPAYYYLSHLNMYIFRTFFTFHVISFYHNLLFGHLRIKINIPKTIVVIIFLNYLDYFRQTKFN